VCAEAQEFFWSTTAFEVQSITSDAHECSFDADEALSTPKHALKMRKVCVRIDVVRFSVGKEYMWPRDRGTTFEEIGLEQCLQRLLVLAEDLRIVLRTSVPSLRVVEIDWADDFSEAVDATSLQMRANVSVPFTSLGGINVQVRSLLIAKKGRREVMTMVRQVLG
jgi:hypothetical protein